MEDEFETTIGLEIHAELKTATKMFCSSLNDPDEMRPNQNVCPVCLAHPGTLPVVNAEAVKQVLRVGAALGSKLADYTEFDRKNYFYPDLPKGYQISQFQYPLVAGGELLGVQITRIHLEEDTASSIHDELTGETVIDFNRSGVPLMELVTEPVIRSPEQAGAFARELQLLLRTLGASEANMEKGQMRVEANVSVAKAGTRSSAYVEIKNLNSFKAMEKAVSYEVKRQIGMLNRGETLIKQTMGWDENKQATFPQRTKEGSADYRYFPDPDIPSLRISEIAGLDRDSLTISLPILPSKKRQQYLDLGISEEDAELYLRSEKLGLFFDQVSATENDAAFIKIMSNYIANDLIKICRDIASRDTENKDISGMEVPISPESFRYIMELLKEKLISSRVAKDLLEMAALEKKNPKTVVEEGKMLEKRSDDDVRQILNKIILANEGVVQEYRAGKENAIQYLVGQGMKELKGSGNPVLIKSLLVEAIMAKK